MPDINTLEEARAEIIRLQDELTERTNERDTLSQNNTSLSQELESVRKLNQTYFNRLRAQDSKEDQEDEPETPPTYEEFCNTLHII